MKLTRCARGINSATPSTPSTHKFRAYIDTVVRPLLLENVSRQQTSVLIDLLCWLEQQRYDYSNQRAFQTRPLSNAAIAAAFSVTDRSVRRWMALLEELGILARRFRKNIRHSYKNLLNRFQFCGFLSWFQEQKPPTPDTQSPPNKKDIINISISSEKSGENLSKPAGFPQTGTIRYDPYWKELAEKHLPSGSGRPCMDMIAQKFRLHLRKYKIAFDAPNIGTHWANYCERAPIIR